MLNLSTPITFKPLKNSRRSEVLAWIMAVLTIAVRIIFPVEGFYRIGGSILAGFFLLSAIIMSIGTWMNRSSELELTEKGLQFFNGAINTSINWEEVVRVAVYRGRFNDKIRIISRTSGINLDVVSVEVLDEVPGDRIGFRDGDKILKTILGMSSLDERTKQEAQGYYYYSKQ